MSDCAVLLAGGKGTRLYPYTITKPKPLMPIGDMPILGIILAQLRDCGFGRIVIAVNHQADQIEERFGDGSALGLRIEYSLEPKPLGTMGPLKLLRELPENFLVMNGDVLTDLDYRAFFHAHAASGALYTISGYNRSHTVDYGVLHVDGAGCLSGFEEKPKIDYTVSMGVYAVNRRALGFIPEDAYFGFDSLMYRLLREGERVDVRVHDGYWLDIGRPSDYAKAIEDFENKRGCFLP